MSKFRNKVILEIKKIFSKNHRMDKKEILVHRSMIYQCENCGKLKLMYLEKGLEDKVFDKKNPNKHKPVPFSIKCNCCESGRMNHILWQYDEYFEYVKLPKGASYFENREYFDCGFPVIR